MPDKLIPLCRLYENVSKTTGQRYFAGNLSFTSKLLSFSNEDAKDAEPGWTLFLADKEVPAIGLNDNAGVLRLLVTVNPLQQPGMGFYDNKGKLRAHAYLDEKNITHFLVFNDDGTELPILQVGGEEVN